MIRIKILRIIWAATVAAIISRLFFIQIIDHSKWQKVAAEKHIMQNELPAKRGQILMMDGDLSVPVVMNSAAWTAAVDPQVVNEEKIVTLMEKEAKDYLIAKWSDVFKDKNRRYYIIAKNLPLKIAEKIKSAKIAGVWLKENPKRVYAEGTLASGVLGFVNNNGVGQYGVEGALNKTLAGKNGLLKTVKDVNNTPLTIGNDRIRVAAQNGENVTLSIDRNIQYQTEKILESYKSQFNAEAVSAIVMNPDSGQILAMANIPNYDPADFGNVKDASAYLNRTTESPYEPASVAKAFTMAAAIQEGVMTPDTNYYNAGSVTVDGWPIENAYKGMLGTITMQDALNYSLNTGSIEALRLLGGGTLNVEGRKKLYDYYVNKFGLGRETGIELFENTGLINSPTRGDGRNSLYANMTFGQNMNVTMLQVITGFSSLVNGGKRIQPSIIAQNTKKVKQNQNQANQKDQKSHKNTANNDQPAQPGDQVISEQTSKTMRNMLFVTRRGSRLRGEDREGYFVGGKTGTAQVIRDGRYTLDETVATYVGFGGSITEGPKKATDLEQERLVDGLPEYIVMVRIEGKGMKFGGEVHAKPIFDKISNYMQQYLRVQPK